MLGKKNRFLRYARRTAPAAARRFGRDERGAVLLMTIVFLLPLVKFLFVGYNTGVALATRMRAQAVADAASYSASLWQARFLNYCAYTRRNIVANYATMALATAHESEKGMVDNIVDCNDLYAGIPGSTWFSLSSFGDNGLITIELTPVQAVLDAALPIVQQTREGCDVMNKWLSVSQTALFNSIAVDGKTAVMQKVVRDAKRWKPIGVTTPEFRLAMIPPPVVASSLRSNPDGGAIVEQEDPITKEEVIAYYDSYTNATCPNVMPLLGRSGSFAGGWVGWGWVPYVFDEEVIGSMNVRSAPVEWKDSDATIYSKERVWWGSYYVFFTIYPWGIPIPIGVPIGGEDSEASYSVQHPFDDTKVYRMTPGLSPGQWEPSSLAVVEAVEEEHPFFGYDNSALGLHPRWLFDGDGRDHTIRAFSRAKTYYAGLNEDLAGYKYEKPNLSYPFWGAKLAPISQENWTLLIAEGYEAASGHLLWPQY